MTILAYLFLGIQLENIFDKFHIFAFMAVLGALYGYISILRTVIWLFCINIVRRIWILSFLLTAYVIMCAVTGSISDNSLSLIRNTKCNAEVV